MKIKIDDNLAIVANRAGTVIWEMSRIMADALLDAGLIEDTEYYYGCNLLQECGTSLAVEIDNPVAKTVCDIMHAIGIELIDDTVYKAFASCIIMGEGDCPKCGGEMELRECEGHEISSGDRDTPPDYEIDYEKWCCEECGYYEWRDLTYDPIEED